MKMELRKSFQFEGGASVAIIAEGPQMPAAARSCFKVEIVVAGECDPSWVG